MTRFVTTTRVDSSKVLRCILGYFHSINEAIILWGYSDRLELYREELPGVLVLFHKQHIHDRLLGLDFLHDRQPSAGTTKLVRAMHMPVKKSRRSIAHHVMLAIIPHGSDTDAVRGIAGP